MKPDAIRAQVGQKQGIGQGIKTSVAEKWCAMNSLKPFDKLFIPDGIQGSYLLVNRETGAARQKTLRDHYSEIEEIGLLPEVPEEIRVHFDTARNLYLYNWFVYRFGPVAELHAIASVEFALKIKSGKKRACLKKLLNDAIQKKWIQDGGFKYYPVSQETLIQRTAADSHRPPKNEHDPDSDNLQAYCKILADSLPYFRNTFAHGSKIIYPTGVATLAICADIINQLFCKVDKKVD